MSTITIPDTIGAALAHTDAIPLPPRASAGSRYVRETRLLVGRGLRMIPRVPERLADVTLQPIMFTLLFTFVLIA